MASVPQAGLIGFSKFVWLCGVSVCRCTTYVAVNVMQVQGVIMIKHKPCVFLVHRLFKQILKAIRHCTSNNKQEGTGIALASRQVLALMWFMLLALHLALCLACRFIAFYQLLECRTEIYAMSCILFLSFVAFQQPAEA